MLGIEAVKRLFIYDPMTGSLLWRVRRGHALPGHTVGNACGSRYWNVRVKEGFDSAQNIAWMISYEERPENKIKFIDGNCRNLRLSNLFEITKTNVISFELASGLIDYDAQRGVFLRKNGGDATLTNKTYQQINVAGAAIAAHRLAWLLFYGEWPDRIVDHIDGNPSNNRILNLRLASRSQNGANAKVRKNKRIPLKGVSENQGRYIATIVVEQKRIRLGAYSTPVEAHLAYCCAAKKYFGEFARFA